MFKYKKHIMKKEQLKKKIFDKDGNELDIIDVLTSSSLIKLPTINRVEVIDENGRSYTKWEKDCDTMISIQDQGRTMKIFISK